MKLVIVDDSNLILKFAEGTLIKNAVPVEITLCRSGEEVLKLMENTAFDIILLDIVMPGMSGIEVLRTVKKEEKYRHTEIIMFTSIGDKETLHECFELGAVDYIAKPIDELEFLARIKSAIRKKSLERSSLQYLREIEMHNASLSALNTKLKTAQNQIIQQEKMASVGHLAAGIAHEINNPLGFITSNFSTLRNYISNYERILAHIRVKIEAVDDSCGEKAELIQLINDPELIFIAEDVPELFNDTQEGLERVGAIVRGLRNFSRIDTIDEMSLYNLNEGIENTLIISRNELKYTADVLLQLGELPDIYAYGGQVNQVILNLLLNACAAIKHKFGTQKGTIEIRTWQSEGSLYLSIKDNGSGIDEKNIKNVFNPFFTTKPVGEGTGLGLSISYDIITVKHGGWIEVNSVVNEWTEFVITLPMNSELADT